MQDARQVVDVLHQIIVLGAGPRDADRVAFLEGVVADEMGRHLAGDADERDRIHQRIGEAGHRIGGARARGDEHDAGLAGRARIAFGRMGGALLVAHQDVLHLLLLEDLVIDRQHRAARIAEHMLDPLVRQRLQHDLGARHLLIASLPAIVFVLPLLPSRLVPSRAIKKAPEGACLRAHRCRGSLGCPGGARSYDKNGRTHALGLSMKPEAKVKPERQSGSIFMPRLP